MQRPSISDAGSQVGPADERGLFAAASAVTTRLRRGSAELRRSVARLGRGWIGAVTEPTTGSPGYWSQLASMLALGGWVYRDAHYLVADVELDAGVARRYVPWPLRLATPARAQVFTGYFPINTFGSVYHEAGVFFDVATRRGPAIYCPWMLVDDDVALIAGRELLGYPKKMGDFTWTLAPAVVRDTGERESTPIHATASRRGQLLIEMSGTLGEQIDAPPPMLGRPHRNVRTALGLALPKVIAFAPRERVVEVRRALLDVRIHGSERDPLHEFGLGRVLDARLHRVDLGGQLPIPIGPASPLAVARQLLLRGH